MRFAHPSALLADKDKDGGKKQGAKELDDLVRIGVVRPRLSRQDQAISYGEGVQNPVIARS